MNVSAANPILFSLNSGQTLLQAVTSELGVEPGQHEERNFEDGEHKIRPLQSVLGADVYVVQSLNGTPEASTNDQLIRLLFFLGALRDAGARRITAITPYLCYARKDRRTKSRDPLSLRYLAQMFEAMGIDMLVTLDVHNPAAFDNAFRCPTRHLSVQSLICEHFVSQLGNEAITVASPDVGGIKRAESLRLMMSDRLQRPIGRALVEKHRSEDMISGEMVAGDIEDRHIIVLDDLIAGGNTMKRAAESFVARGAAAVYCAASHGIFTEQAGRSLSISTIQQVVISNSLVPLNWPEALPQEKRVTLDISPLLAQTIRHLHESF